MVNSEPIIDSSTKGDPERFIPLADLAERLQAMPPSPVDEGTVTLIVTRRVKGRRESLGRVRLESETGIPGDSWGRARKRVPHDQIAVMETGVAELIANGQSLTLFGDNLFLNLDLSIENLPVESRVKLGTAVMEVTPKEHNGCSKFRARFGKGALDLVWDSALRHRNLRGIYLTIVEGGEVGPGDTVQVLSRGISPPDDVGQVSQPVRVDRHRVGRDGP